MPSSIGNGTLPSTSGPGGSNEENTIHGTAGRRREISGTATNNATSSSAKGDVSLFTAYLLYFLFGITGSHHAYLNRPRQGLAWYATGGLFGLGLVRDFFRLPYYVSLARSGGDIANAASDDVALRVRDATIRARNGVPKMSLARIILMAFFGSYFGLVASSLAHLPEDGSWTAPAYRALWLAGAAAGIWLAGNIGDETIATKTPDGGTLSRRGEFARLAAWCLGGSVVANAPALGGIFYAVRRRRYRTSMSLSSSTGRRRVGRHLLTCAVFTLLVAVAAFNHGGVTVNGNRVYLRDAMRNAYHSRFWEEFDWERFREESSAGGGNSGEYLKKAFDLQGARAARRTLGVAKGAPHSEVRSSYKKLALKYHPDKIGSDASDREVVEAQKMFVKVQEAYEVLNDIEQKRKKAESAPVKGGGGGNDRRNRPHRDEM